MMYKVLQPFAFQGMRFRRGQTIDDTIVDQWKNKATLLRIAYIEPQMETDTYRVHRPFTAGGRRFRLGEIVRNPGWRNLQSLIGAGYLQPVPAEEDAAESEQEKKELWKDRDWLFQRYLVEKRSPVDIAKEAGCSIGTLYHWINKYGLKKPGWRKRKG